MVFQYNFFSNALIEDVTGVKAVLVVKSVAQTNGLPDDALRAIFYETYDTTSKEDKIAIYNELVAAHSAS